VITAMIMVAAAPIVRAWSQKAANGAPVSSASANTSATTPSGHQVTPDFEGAFIAFLSIAILARGALIGQRQATVRVPRVFWFWIVWAVLELIACALSPAPKAAWSEIRHLLLLAGLFFVMPSLDQPLLATAVWKGIFLTASLGSLFLIGDFIARWLYYRRELSVSADPALYLRSGGLLNNWMVYASVEVLVFAGLLAFSSSYPEQRRLWAPLLAVNGVAALFTLTRILWLCCFLLAAAQLIRRRSRWFWILPLLPFVIFLSAPAPIRSRLTQAMRPSYYSNAERLQMLKVGWKMVRDHPILGVGAGRVEQLYRSYLTSSDPVPAYYRHLHNNVAELTAEFGLPVTAAALVFVIALFAELRRRWKAAIRREDYFLCQTAILALCGFLVTGMVDYTYGHSLALILLAFAVLMPLTEAGNTRKNIT